MEQNIRILIIEDDDALGKALKIFLLPHTPHVEIRQTGKDGLAEIQQQSADVVLLDIRLPDMSGMDVLAQLRTNIDTRHTPVVTMTAFDEEPKTLLQAGATAHLPKSSPDFSSPVGLWAVVAQAMAAAKSVPVPSPAKPQLNGEEVRLLRELADGKSVKMAAHNLNVAERTIYRQIAELKEKLGASNLTELIAQAARAGLLG